MPVVFDGYKNSRDEVFNKLASHNIHARKYFWPLTNESECFAGLPGFDSLLTPVAKFIADHVITLPMYSDLQIEDVDKICDIITL